jgi:hypothetical protein
MDDPVLSRTHYSDFSRRGELLLSATAGLKGHLIAPEKTGVGNVPYLERYHACKGVRVK